MLLETARRALTRRNIKWLLTRRENHLKSNQTCFYPDLGKVFHLPEFQAKLFSSEFEWVVLRETASLTVTETKTCEKIVHDCKNDGRSLLRNCPPEKATPR